MICADRPRYPATAFTPPTEASVAPVFVESPLDGQDLVVESFLFCHGDRGSRNARRGEAPRAWLVATKAAALALVAARGPRADALLRGAACAFLVAAHVLGGELALAGLALRGSQRLGDVLQLPPGV